MKIFGAFRSAHNQLDPQPIRCEALAGPSLGSKYGHVVHLRMSDSCHARTISAYVELIAQICSQIPTHLQTQSPMRRSVSGTTKTLLGTCEVLGLKGSVSRVHQDIYLFLSNLYLVVNLEVVSSGRSLTKSPETHLSGGQTTRLHMCGEARGLVTNRVAVFFQIPSIIQPPPSDN